MPTCDGCGKRIVWGMTAEGKRIPLDPTPPVYLVDAERRAVGGTFPVRIASLCGDGEVRIRSAMVSHFATCPKANDF